MGTTKIIIALVLVAMVQIIVKLDLISIEGLGSEVIQYSDRFDSKNQSDFKVGTIKMSYAECREGILKSDLTIALSIASHVEVVHSFREARAFLIRTKGKSNVMVMFPNATRVEMDETFCDQSQAEKDRTLLAAVQAELLD